MNILEVASGHGLNGAIRHCALLTQELARRGHRVTLLCRPGSWIAGHVRSRLDSGQDSGPIEVIESDLDRWPLDELRRVGRLVSAQRIDVVHTHMSRAHFFGVLLRCFADVPIVATAHNQVIQPHWMFNHRVIAVSEAVARFQRRYNLVRKDRMSVIHGFVDLAAIDRVPSDARRAARASLGIADASPIIGAIGSVFREKGMLYVVQAFASLVRSVPEARLVIVGSGPASYRQLLTAELTRLGAADRVIWTGARDDVSELMRAMDLFVAGSLEEAFGIAILEAMAARLPVVATSVGGVPECVVDGETGVLVPARSSERLAEAVRSLVDDAARRRRFGERGRARVERLFSADTQVPKVELVLQEARDWC